MDTGGFSISSDIGCPLSRAVLLHQFVLMPINSLRIPEWVIFFRIDLMIKVTDKRAAFRHAVLSLQRFQFVRRIYLPNAIGPGGNVRGQSSRWPSVICTA